MAKGEKLAIPSSKVEISLTPGSTEPAMKAVEAKSTKLYKVPTGAIKTIPGFNVRVPSPDYVEHRDMIANSIVANGYDQTKPLAGFVAKEGDKNVIYVTDGHTRLDAVKQLIDDGHEGLDMLPVLVHANDKSLTDLTVALHTSNSGRPLTPFELGVVVKRLLRDEKADKGTIAERLAVTPRYLDDVLLLVNSPKEIRDIVLAGTVSPTLAIQELRRDPEEAVARLTDAVAKAGGKKVTKKSVGTKMSKSKTVIAIEEGTDIKEIVKTVAALIRKAVPVMVAGEGDEEVKTVTIDGAINVVIEVPAPEKPAKVAKPKKAKAKAKPAKKTKAAPIAEPEAETEEAPAPKAKAKAKAKAKPVKKAKPAADIEIEGAEELEVTSDLDDEPVLVPPIVKNGEGVDDEEDDI